MAGLEQVAADLSAAAAHLADHVAAEHPWHAARSRTPPELVALDALIRQARQELASLTA